MKPIKVSKTPPPGWPTEKEWKKIEKIMAKATPTRVLPPNASLIDRIKEKLCAQFVIYLQEEKVTQRELARRLGTTEARVSEIIHYHLDKVTTDRLIGYLSIIRPSIKFKVA